MARARGNGRPLKPARRIKEPFSFRDASRRRVRVTEKVRDPLSGNECVLA